MKKKLTLRRMKDGPDEGHIGAFDGDTLVNLVDAESLRQCFDDLEEEGWPDGDGQKRRGSIGLTKLVNEKYGHRQQLRAGSLTKFLNEKFHLVEDMGDDLGLMILMKMREKNCEYAEALREVTRTEPGATLWREHQGRRRG